MGRIRLRRGETAKVDAELERPQALRFGQEAFSREMPARFGQFAAANFASGPNLVRQALSADAARSR